MRERLTKNDVEKIQAEIEHRKLVERKELIEAVKEARSHGDLSENFEYQQRKQRIRMKAASVIWRECSRQQRLWKIIPKQMRLV